MAKSRAWLRRSRGASLSRKAGSCSRVSTTTISSPRLSILVTSREPLGIYGEHMFVVPTLGLPDPVGPRAARGQKRSPSEVMFLERARAARPSFATDALDQPVVAQICVRLEGLPLALELAASRARTMSRMN